MNKKTYNQLRAEWYAKLKRQGFVDIETVNGELKEYTSTLVGNYKKITTQNGGWESKEAYYQMATRFLNEHKFKTKLEHAMWDYHSNGMSYREIAKTMNKLKAFKKRGYFYVFSVISPLKKIMFGLYLKKDDYNEH